MVTTRGQSGALCNAAPLSPVGGQIEDEMDQYSDDDHSSEAQSDDNDSSYSPAPQTQRARRSKRTETLLPHKEDSNKKAAQHSKGKGKARELMKTFFGTLPLDLIFEIFSYLHPSDLLRLSRSGKRIRSLLMSRKSISIWKNARLRLPNVPDCPPDQSEPQWAHLIFENDCTICGTPAIRKVDWHLRIRGCETCLKEHVVYFKTAAKQMPHIEDMQEVLELLPYSHTGGWAHGHSSSSRFYFTGAIEKMAEELDDYKLRVDAGVPGAVAELEKFKEIKRKQSEGIVRNGAVVKQWAILDSAAKANTNQDLRNKRKDAVRAKLLDQGHDQQDIQRVLWSSDFVHRAAELTERSWARGRKSLEEAVLSARTERLALEREALLRSRREAFDRFYPKFFEKIGHPLQGLYPSAEDARTLAQIASFIEQDHTIVTEKTFEVFEDNLNEFVIAWRRERLFALLQKMASSGIVTVADPPVEDDLRKLELAIANFCCKRPKWWLSLQDYTPTVIRADDSIYWHACIKNRSVRSLDCLVFDIDPVEGLIKFLEMMGLDPAAATASELDLLDARVYCQECSLDQGTTAHSWRSAVLHLQKHTYLDKPWSGWIKLSDADTQVIKDGENSGIHALGGDVRRFICQLCTDLLPGKSISAAQRESHIRKRHPGHVAGTSYFLADPNVAPLPLTVATVQATLRWREITEKRGSGS
ncbi:hypothetical protein FRC03_006039 [Tulasnella sp. 419]|nr:hypothetical protein FRC03_006039 [Tulasnella sp. 419]